MSFQMLLQGLKKSAVGLFILLGAIDYFVESAQLTSRDAFNSWFPSLYILPIAFYVAINIFYRQKRIMDSPNGTISSNQLTIAVVLTIIIGAILQKIFSPVFYVGTLALGILFLLAWLLEERKRKNLGFLAFLFIIIAFLPLFLSNELYISIVSNFLLGFVLIIMGVVEHFQFSFAPQ